MALFQLDPQSIAARVRSNGGTEQPPGLVASLSRGTIGFMVVSVAGFAPWPIINRWFGAVGEVGLYVACTVVFIGLSGACLHRLVIGPGSLSRFYKLFALAFILYAVAWVACWMWLRGDEGSLGGLLAGTTAMGLILALAFDAWREVWKVILALFVLNTFGYFAGGWVEGKLIGDQPLAAMLLWGACYGLGFGAGLGLAFYWCQSRARALLSAG